ncbi:hypothetical protein [Streptomyces sp. NPDC002328]|uniref:hypothetical protein n=1 Tax=Streptomyces sp. NPDC002328 TaxID=3364642 RepID=UPI0036A896AD
MILITLVLAMVVVVLTLLVASALAALVRFRPALTAPVQVAMTGIATMTTLMTVLVTATR